MNEYRIGFADGDFEKAFVCKKLGADYHEISLNLLYALTDDEVDSYIERTKNANIPIEVVKNLIPGELKFGIENPDFDEIDEYLEKSFERAKRLGVKIGVLGSSGARSYPEGDTYEQGFERLVFFIKEHLIPMCEKYDITIALENLSYGETNIINTIDEAYNVVKACGSDRVRMLVDFYHFANNKDSLDSIRRAKDYIIHTHFASLDTGRMLPTPTDSDPYQDYINLLREIGYTGRLSFEAGLPEGVPYEEAASTALNLFRKL